MSSYDTRAFQHNGRTYEIRIASDGATVRVRAFLDGRPANGFEYSVDIAVLVDAATQKYPPDLVETLVETAEVDVKDGLWERALAAATLVARPEPRNRAPQWRATR
jgi:hypothetical protein